MTPSKFFAVIFTLLVTSSFEMLLCSARPPVSGRRPHQGCGVGVFSSSKLLGVRDQTRGKSEEKKEGPSSPRSIRQHEQDAVASQRTQLPVTTESIIDIGGNASSKLHSEAFPLQAAELIFSLLKNHVSSVKHPLKDGPPVFFTFEDRFKEYAEERSNLKLLDGADGRLYIYFDSLPLWSGFSMHPRTSGFSPVQIHFADETLAKSVFQQVYGGDHVQVYGGDHVQEYGGDDVQKKKNQLINDFRRLWMTLDFDEGVVYLNFTDEEMLPLLKVTDIVRAYLMMPGENTKVIPFQKLSLSVVKAPCKACLDNEAVDEYVRLSKSMIMVMHKRRSEFRKGNVLQYCWWKLKRAWKRIIRQKPPSLPMESVSKRIENELYTWTSTSISPVEKLRVGTTFSAVGVLFARCWELIVYSDGIYHKFKFLSQVPQTLQSRGPLLVRRARVKIVCIETTNCLIYEHPRREAYPKPLS